MTLGATIVHLRAYYTTDDGRCVPAALCRHWPRERRRGRELPPVSASTLFGSDCASHSRHYACIEMEATAVAERA